MIFNDSKVIGRIVYLKISYFLSLIRIKKSSKGHPISVLFFVSEIAKWKLQSLYELFENDNRYDPSICVYPMQKETALSADTLSSMLDEKLSFFRNKKMRSVSIWDIEKKCVDRTLFKTCGIIFYQQPWDTPPAPMPMQVSSKFLTFYIPYFLVNNFSKDLELCQGLQRDVFRYIVQSNSIKDFFYSQISKYKFAGEIVGLGHPSTDLFQNVVRENKDFTVIYAPHYSFPYNSTPRALVYSTFLENGELILDYAKKHPEVKWIFKPHPRLKSELSDTGAWTKEKVDRYYEEWERIGKSCYTADYQELFVNSDLMLTDCGSFLSEYACTKNPIIRMVSPLLTLSANPVLEELYSTYYCTYSNEELNKALDLLIVQRLDPNKEKRCQAIEEVGFSNYSAAENIKNYISELLHI